VNLDEANVGFKHWHPMPVTQDGGKLSGQGEMGGLWEWTSSALEKQDGFEPMKLYPAYSGKSCTTKIMSKARPTDIFPFLQTTSTTGSTILCLVDLGALTLESPEERACRIPCLVCA